jgi:hypothetical protein
VRTRETDRRGSAIWIDNLGFEQFDHDCGASPQGRISGLALPARSPLNLSPRRLKRDRAGRALPRRSICQAAKPASCDFQPEILESRTIGAAILAADVCGSCPTVTAGLNVKRQRFADPEVIRIDARVFQCKNVQKGIGTTRVISDKSEPAIGYPFF